MATAFADLNEHDSTLEDRRGDTARLEEVFDRAMQRFGIVVMPQLEMRSLALAARRFVTIPGAQWEGDFGSPLPDAIKLEINLARDGLEKICRDYNENRVIPDFRPAGGKGDDDSAATLDGLHRADSYYFKAQQARDNAFFEGTAGGFGAYRLTNEWADPYDKESDHQRINPGLAIVDADQRVFFGPSDLYDKSDAPYAFVVTAHDRTAWEEEHPDSDVSWPDLARLNGFYDWFTADVVKTAEYYETEDHDEKLLILTHRLSGEEERYWESEIEDAELADMKKMGWQVRTRDLKRKRIHKYVLTGAEVLHDQGLIAGDRIPIAPYYGKRSFADGIERFEGYVQGKMDVQRLYNLVMSKLAETSIQSPREIPIFAPEQMTPTIAEQWAQQLVNRPAFALAKPLLNPVTGEPISLGPIGKVEAPQVDQATAVLVQIARNDLVYDQQDGSDTAKANTSEDALAFAATRVDAKSGIFLDNWRQTVQCEGEIYLSKCADTYFEAGRQVETMTEDGNDGMATLVELYTSRNGKTGYRNDFTRGHYKVVVTVTEATATRREKTVRASLNIAAVAVKTQDQELGQIATLTAVMNQDGEGMQSFQKYARKRLVLLGVEEPTDDEKQQMEQAQQQPNPEADLVAAKIDETQASATDKKTHAVLNLAQAHAAGSGDATPDSPVETIGKLADAHKDMAEAEQIRTETTHLPQKLAIEATNAETQRLKVHQQSVLDRIKGMFGSQR